MITPDDVVVYWEFSEDSRIRYCKGFLVVENVKYDYVHSISEKILASTLSIEGIKKEIESHVRCIVWKEYSEKRPEGH